MLTAAVILMGISMVACGDSDQVALLERAESLMEEHPDSALTVIDAIDTLRLDSDRERARYALLRSMALDKNLIDTTEFTVLQPAIDYYVDRDKGSANEKLRTLYYKGRIFQNRGDDDKAMRAFVTARDYEGSATDTLTLARLLVAQGSLYFSAYKHEDFLKTTLKAASLYGKKNMIKQQFKNLEYSLKGSVVLKDTILADSIYHVCETLMDNYPEGRELMIPEKITYFSVMRPKSELMQLVNSFADNHSISNETKLSLANACLELGDCDSALKYLSAIENDSTITNTPKYLSIRTVAYEKVGNYTEAFTSYKKFSSITEEQIIKNFKQELAFEQDRHNLELKIAQKSQAKNKILLCFLCSVFILSVAIGILYFRYRMSKIRETMLMNEQSKLNLQKHLVEEQNKRLTLEKANAALEAENQNVKLKKAMVENEMLAKKKRNLELENHNLELEKQNLALEKKSAELEMERANRVRYELEEKSRSLEIDLEGQKLLVDSLEKKIIILEEEKQNLEDILKNNKELSMPVKEAIKERLEVLNKILLSEITHNEKDYDASAKLIEGFIEDRAKFMNNTRLAYKISHPGFIKYLEDRNLTEDEINLMCLYAMGMIGKEVTSYTKKNGHYNVGSRIRKKLGLQSDSTILSIYIKNLRKEF